MGQVRPGARSTRPLLAWIAEPTAAAPDLFVRRVSVTQFACGWRLLAGCRALWRLVWPGSVPVAIAEPENRGRGAAGGTGGVAGSARAG